MPVTSVDTWLAAGKQFLPISKASVTSVAGLPYSLWLSTGVPAAGAAPGAAGVPTAATTGAPLYTNPVGPALAYLGGASMMGAVSGVLTIYDRLSHFSGLNGTLATLQSVNTATITRGDTTGLNVEAFLEWYTATGATAVNATVAWTDQSNTGRSSVIALAATRPASFLAPITMTSGASGVRSVQSVTLSASTLTAGNFGVTLARRLATIPIIANTPVSLDAFATGLPRAYDDACLWFTFTSSTTSTGILSGAITLGSG